MRFYPGAELDHRAVCYAQVKVGQLVFNRSVDLTEGLLQGGLLTGSIQDPATR